MKFSLSDPAKHEATLAYSYVRFQSAADHQNSTAAGQRKLPFTSRLGTGNIGHEQALLPDPFRSLDRLLLMRNSHI